MAGGRAKWFSAGNEAVGFVAMGNMATGVFAFGNVARGVFAFGNLAVGVVAIGNVGFGILFGGGATVSAGLVAYAGCLAFPVWEGFSAAVDLSPYLIVGVVPVLAWLAASFLWKGERAPRPERRRLVRLDRLASGGLSAGWVRALLSAVSGDRLELAVDGQQRLEVETRPGISDRARLLPPRDGPPRVDAYLEVVEQPSEDQAGGYREAPEMERTLRCADIRPAPEPALPWASKGELERWLCWAWRGGAALGAAFLVGRLLGLLI